jgi:hypothetical protein
VVAFPRGRGSPVLWSADVRGIGLALGERPMSTDKLMLSGDELSVTLVADETGGGGKPEGSMSRDPLRDSMRGES